MFSPQRTQRAQRTLERTASEGRPYRKARGERPCGTELTRDWGRASKWARWIGVGLVELWRITITGERRWRRIWRYRCRRPEGNLSWWSGTFRSRGWGRFESRWRHAGFVIATCW